MENAAVAIVMFEFFSCPGVVSLEGGFVLGSLSDGMMWTVGLVVGAGSEVVFEELFENFVLCLNTVGIGCC